MSSRVTSDNIDIKTALFQYVNPRGKIYSILDNGLFSPNVVRLQKSSSSILLMDLLMVLLD